MNNLVKRAAIASTALLAGCSDGTSIPQNTAIGSAKAIPSTVTLPSISRLTPRQSWVCDGAPDTIQATPAIDGQQTANLGKATVFVADGSEMRHVTQTTAAAAGEKIDFNGAGFGEFNAAAEAAGLRSIKSFGEGGFGFVLNDQKGSETLRLGVGDVRYENQEPGEDNNTLAVTFNNGTTVTLETANLTYDDNNIGWVDLDASKTGGLFTAFKINSPTGASFTPKTLEMGGCDIHTEDKESDDPVVKPPVEDKTPPKVDSPTPADRRNGEGRGNNVDGHASLNQSYQTIGFGGYQTPKFG